MLPIMSPELNTALSLCRNLPSPAGVAVRIIELAQDPETDIATAADVISMDMALSARMMRIANSPLYASRRRIENLGQALTMLGLHATLQLALGFSLSNVPRLSVADLICVESKATKMTLPGTLPLMPSFSASNIKSLGAGFLILRKHSRIFLP